MSLLHKKHPIVINPELAVRVGLNEAIVLQQLAYWLEETEAGIEHEGRRWVYNTQEQWRQQFSFWSVDTVKRAFTSLQKQGLVLVKQLAKSKHDRTNYYAIDYDRVALLDQCNLPSSKVGNLPSSKGADSALLHTETTTETSTERLPARPAVPMTGELIDAEPRSESSIQEQCREVWKAYSRAYQGRYGVEPVRNAKINAQVKQLVQRLGAEAPDVAEFYVLSVNDAFIVRGVHDLGLMLSRCEAYRTQWATGRSMTATRAKQVDQTQANYSAADEAMALIQKRRGMQHAQ